MRLTVVASHLLIAALLSSCGHATGPTSAAAPTSASPASQPQYPRNPSTRAIAGQGVHTEQCVREGASCAAKDAQCCAGLTCVGTHSICMSSH
jgi:hypothetical protein